MTLQQTTAPIKPSASKAFAKIKTPSKPRIAVDNTIQDKEATMAKKIAKSARPIIIITEQSAKSYSKLSHLMGQTFPNVPVIFENAQAKKMFLSEAICNHEFIRNSCVGHFEAVSDYNSSPMDSTCREIKTSDCVIVFGTPQAELKKELIRHGDYFVNETNAPATSPRINMSVIVDMKRNKDAWKLWNQNLMAPRSL